MVVTRTAPMVATDGTDGGDSDGTDGGDSDGTDGIAL